MRAFILAHKTDPVIVALPFSDRLFISVRERTLEDTKALRKKIVRLSAVHGSEEEGSESQM